jgi:hypothetical protein
MTGVVLSASLALWALLTPARSGAAGGYTAAHSMIWDKLTNDVRAGRFLNYDGDKNTSRHDRDWPITLIFYRNAWIDKVKKVMDYGGGGDPEYEFYKRSRNVTRHWDVDGGKKKHCIHGSDTHYRVYAPSGSSQDEHLWDPVWGYYVASSTHYDHGECASVSQRWFGLSERAEFQVIADARDIVYEGHHLVIRQDFFDTNNREPYRKETHETLHRWENDGQASAIKID